MNSSVTTSQIAKTAYALILVFFLVPLFALQSAPRKEIELRIRKFELATHGFRVLVDVKNVGNRSVVLGKTGMEIDFPADDALQSLDIQQWDSDWGWQHIGPCHDIAPITAVTLAPGQTIEDSIPISDKAHGWGGAPCPVRIAHLGGKIRAILYYAYSSETAFQERKASHTNIVSPSVELPRMKN